MSKVEQDLGNKAQNDKLVFGLHFYQPPRFGTHDAFLDISTDPLGVDWTAEVNRRCYCPIAKSGVLGKISFTYYPTLAKSLEKIDPETASTYQKAAISNGIGGPFVHAILPDLTLEDKGIVVGAGQKEMPATHFWAPESALDYQTLQVIRKYNFRGVVCDPRQIRTNLDPINPAHNILTKIDLDNGLDIIAIPYDGGLSNACGFYNYGGSTPEAFVKEQIEWRLNGRVLISWTDGETYGGHNQNNQRYLSEITQQILAGNIISINDLNLDKAVVGALKDERMAWSCHCGNLARWSGDCACHDYQNEYGQKIRPDLRWKAPFHAAHQELNDSITKVIKPRLGSNYLDEMIGRFAEGYQNRGLDSSHDPRLALISAKVSALTARTSCATFFADPGTSGFINLVFAKQAVLHLREAGLGEESREIRDEYEQNLTKVPMPEICRPIGLTARDVYHRLLNRQPQVIAA